MPPGWAGREYLNSRRSRLEQSIILMEFCKLYWLSHPEVDDGIRLVFYVVHEEAAIPSCFKLSQR